MAPTVHSGASNSDRGKHRPGVPEHRSSELVARVKYCNTLPDIPFDPKFITYPFESHRFVQYKPTSLERSYKFDLLTEHDLGVNIDLINPDVYSFSPSDSLHNEDERLLEEDVLALQDSTRSRHHNKTVPWLKKTEYISTEFSRYGHSSDKTETKVGYNVKKVFKEEDLYMDRESQVNAINKTFEDAKIPIEKHYSKPSVVPVEVLPIFPDFQLWKYPFAQVTFDSDPASTNQTEEMSQAMIRGVMDESGEQFVAYFLPTEEATLKRKRDAEEKIEYTDEEEYEYKMAREYNWNVKNKASKGYEENYFFVIREDGVFYDELETRVRLSKRRLKPGVQPNNSKLVVQHRPLNEAEFKMQELRMMQLEPPQEEEEEEQEPEQEREQAASEDEENGEAEKETKTSDAEDASSSENGNEEKGAEDDKAESDADSSKSSNENEKQKNTASSAESAASSSSSSAESGSESDVEAEEEQRKKRDEEEIFGSDSN